MLRILHLSEGIPVFLGNGFAGLVDGLDNFRLRGDSHLNPCKVVRTLADVKVEIELHAVGLDDMLAVALHLIVKAVLPIEQVGVLREGHPLGDSGGQVYGLDGLESLALATFDTGYYLLILRNIDFEILHGLIPSVGDEDNILEPRMLKFGDYHLYRTAVGHVARKFQIVDGKMRREGVHDDFQCLLERQVLLVVSPADVHQVETDVESTAQYSSLPIRLARSLKRAIRFCSVIFRDSLVMLELVSVCTEGVFTTRCHFSIWE